MAFTPGTIDRLAVAIDGIEWWDYRTTDTIATVEGAGYFNSFATEFNLNDKLLVTAADNILQYYISAITKPVNIQGVGTTSAAASVTVTRFTITPLIPAGAITNSLLANMANNTVKGNISGGSAAPSDLSAPNVMTLLQTTSRFYVGTFTRTMATASGNAAVTGVGFMPKGVILAAGSSVANGVGSVGFMAESGTTGSGIYGDFAGTTFTSAGAGIFVGNTPTAQQTATLVSLDSDGFTLAWVKTGAPTGTATIAFLAIR